MSTTETNKLWDMYDNLEEEHEFLLEDYNEGEYDWPEYAIPDSDIALNREALRDIHQQLQQSTQPPHISIGETLAETETTNDLIGLDNNPKNSEIDIVQFHGKGSSQAMTTSTTTITAVIDYPSNSNAMSLLLVLCIMVWLGFQFKKHRSLSAEKRKQLPYYDDQK